MIHDLVYLETVIEYLNELIKLDPHAMDQLVKNRVECNQRLASHPTAQSILISEIDGERYEIGILGVLNGLFGIDDQGWGGIVAMFDDNGILMKFCRSNNNRQIRQY